MENKDTSGIVIPSEDDLDTKMDNWKNEYNETTGLVSKEGEISKLLTAVKIILNINDESDTTIDGFKTDDVKLNTVINEKDTILKSLIITATIKDKITSIGDITTPVDENLSQTNLTGWKNEYNETTGLVSKEGEISALLTAVGIALNINNESTTNIDNIDTSDIKLATIINRRNDVLKSLVITATIKSKVTSFEGISAVPEEEYANLSPSTLVGWKNEYNETTGLVSKEGEVSALLVAVGIVFNITPETNLNSDLSANSINLNTVITRKVDILRSIIITATVKDKITSGSSGVVIPSEENLNTKFAPWKNTYNETTGLVSTEGEISRLLDAIKIILNIDDESATTIDGVDTNDIKLNTVISNQDTILKSLVITATVKDKIVQMAEPVDATISIPSDENLSTTNLTGWKNVYEGNVVSEYGEIAHLLNAINIVLTFDDSTKIDNFNANDIKLGKIVYEKDEILKSLIISETVRKQIVGNSTLKKPTSLSADDLTGWKSTYDEEGLVTSYGELAYLLTSIKYALNIQEDDDTSFDDINVDTIKVKDLVDNRQEILHSAIITLTIKDQILAKSSEDDSQILRLPAGYESQLSANYILWENDYTDTTYNSSTKEFNFTVNTVGEIDKVLAAIGELLADKNVPFSAISTFNYASVFEPIPQAKLIASKLISETIIQTISANAVSIPNDPSLGLVDNTDRTAWWSENGELKYFLNAVGLILGDSEKQSLSVDLNINDTYSKITNEATRGVLFKSYLIAETLTVNFTGLDLFTSSIPTPEHAGIDLTATNTDGSNNRDAWYIINTSGATRSIENKELWDLVTSIHILLGDDFDTTERFSIDQILDNDELKPYLDDNKVNNNDKVGELLHSKVIEEVFIGVVKSLVLGDGVLAPYLNLPVNPNWYLYLTEEGQEYDTRTIIESIYQMQNHAEGKTSISYRTVSTLANADNIAAAMELYTTLQNLDTEALACAFVVSRTFHGSIEKFFNGIFRTIYKTEYDYGGSFLGMQPWDDVELHQANYEYLDPTNPDKVSVSATLKANIDTIITNIEKAIV